MSIEGCGRLPDLHRDFFLPVVLPSPCLPFSDDVVLTVFPYMRLLALRVIAS